MRHVRNVDLQLEVAIRHAAHGDRIVEVARGFAVDGDDGKRAVIVPMAQLARRNYRIELLRLLQHLDRKAVRQVKLANDDFDVHAEVVFVAENLDHPAARISRRRRPLGDLHFDDHAFQVAPLVLARLGAQDAIAIRASCEKVASHRSPAHPQLRRMNGAPAARPRLASKRRTRTWGAESSPWGHSMPRGMMISLVTFSSMGVT